MRAGFFISAGVALVAVMVFWLLTGGTEPLDARYALSDCRVVKLRDVQTGKMIAGAEDLGIIPERDLLVVSAYDRADEVRPFTGIFGVPLFDIEQGASEIEVEELINAYSLPGGVKPQGIDISPGGERIALVNHLGGRDDHTTTIDVMAYDQGFYVQQARYEHDAFCRANDLVFGLEGNILITRDRAQCRLSPIDMIPFHATGLLLEIDAQGELKAHEERYFYPTGIALGPTGKPIISETRAGRLSGGYVDAPLPGAPEKITVDDVGALTIAVHPSPWKTFFYKNGFAFSTPSRVVRADPERTDLEILFDDPGGDLMSAVSVGLVHNDTLYLGSSIDEGIAVCRN